MIRIPRPPMTAATLIATVVLLGGCGAADTPEDGQDAESSAPSTSANGAAGTSTASAAPQDLPQAADGTDLAACSDADCEVQVAEGDEFPLDGGYGLDRMVFDTVDEETVAFSGYGPGSQVSGSVPAPSADTADTALFVMNGIEVTVVAVDGEHAIVRLTPP
ncbi:hypothetical protein [Marinactinospora rubrisoli]|uniref:Uncharacterized protein n=1 Tax=Marinactinospora rubrisoli TaxID=2715399 RepID=A0ABW2KFF4_9ACTN